MAMDPSNPSSSLLSTLGISPFFFPNNLITTLLFSLLFALSFLPSPSTSRIQVVHRIPTTPNPNILYSTYCNHIVSDAPPDPTVSSSASALASLRFSIGFFTGGDQLLLKKSSSELPKAASFIPFYAHKALSNESESVYRVKAKLRLRVRRLVSASSYAITDRRELRLLPYRIGDSKYGFDQFRFSGPGFPFTGLWSESTMRLCMVGSVSVYTKSGNSELSDAVLKLNYSTNSSIYGSLISGVLECVNNKSDSYYFEPVSILGIRNNNENFEYTLASKEKADCLEGGDNLSIKEVKGGLCSLLNEHIHMFGLKYDTECGNFSCNPLKGNVGDVPEYMSLRQVGCIGEGKMQVLLAFGNSSRTAAFPFGPNSTLIAEGDWNEKKTRFCGVACRILNFTDSLSNAGVGDCTIKISFRFPAVLSIKKKGAIIGEIWSDRKENDPEYFSKIKFWSLKEPFPRIPGLRYEYTEINGVRATCASKNNVKVKGKNYPSSHSSDMKVYMNMKNSKGLSSAFASPLFVGDELYRNLLAGTYGAEQHGVAVNLNNNQGSLVNISYTIRFESNIVFGGEIDAAARGTEISAEGTYNRDTGVLCMIGCQSLKLNNGTLMTKDSFDCDILINIQFSPLNSQSNDRLKGTIESRREKTDALYFELVELWSHSMSIDQAKDSLWRMDLEITMVLMSNALACVFVGLQLYHVKNQPDVLPFISTVMLGVLALGHMILLLLNFEAVFLTNRNQQAMYFQNGGWLEVNEIVVRIVTMIAFLLECRLLQLSWTSRRGTESQKGIWASELKVLGLSLPLYFIGALITWIVNLLKNAQQNPFLQSHPRHLLRRTRFPHVSFQQYSLWSDLKSYGGLILDGFLLPQILFNTIYNSRDKALATSFYIPTTLVRVLPHAYDLYRTHSYGTNIDWSYIYANHKMDFYSTAWDIIIPCGCLLFAFIVFMQQRVGGRCFLPNRFRDNFMYEKVPAVSSVELQGHTVQNSSFSL